MTTADRTPEQEQADDAVGIPLDRPVRALKPWPSYVAGFLLNDMTGACKRRGLTVQTCGIDPADIGYLIRLNWEGHIDRKTARASLEFMLDHADEMREFLDYVLSKMQ
jgi:Asp-tRNA(Asn)/Glu-tRNA(Gln) amidotransferase B subunit